jgi:hypothetical protein
MFRLVLSKLQELLQGPRKSSESRKTDVRAGELLLAPLPVAVRVDSALPIGSRGDLQVSRLIWVTAPSDGGPSEKLHALFYPN